MNSADSHPPLSPAVLHILLALAGEDRHGYAIMTEIARQTGGRYKMGPGTLYDNLGKLLDQGLVEETRHRPAIDDPRRKYYTLTRFGRERSEGRGGQAGRSRERGQGASGACKEPRVIAARLYSLLARLHPQAFRERFGQEMICVFDEVGATWRPRLFVDCLISLARQWLLRSDYWKVAASGAGAVALLAAAATAWLAAMGWTNALVVQALRPDGSMPMGGALLLASGILVAMLLGMTVVALTIGRKVSGIGRRRQRRRVGVHK
jgi:DNA-binding PadR family transcriptional regulator